MANGKVVDSVGEEIYAIFVEEVGEILNTLQALLPSYLQNRHDFKRLTEVRRQFHTLKGSGRMVSAFALGDFAWAYENMLNQVLSGSLEPSERLGELLLFGLARLRQRREFFLEACEADAQVNTDVALVEMFVAGEAISLPSSHEMESSDALDLSKLSTEIVPTSTQSQSDDIKSSALPVAIPEWSDFLITHNEQPKPLSPVITEALPKIADHFLAYLQPNELGLAKQASSQLDTSALPPLVIDSDNLLILKLFWEEASEHLSALDSHLAALQVDMTDRDAHLQLERVLHTLKGGARMAQLNVIGDLAHQAETNLTSEPTLTPQVINTLQIQIDQINTLVEYYEAKTLEASQTSATGALITKAKAEVPTEIDSAAVTLLEEDHAALADTHAFDVLTEKSDGITANTEPVIATLPAITHTLVVEAEAIKSPEKAGVHYDSLLEQVLIEQASKLAHLTLDQTPLPSDDTVKPSEDDPLQSATIQDQVRLPTAFLDHVIDQSSTLNVQQSRTHERIHSLSADVGELGRTVARLRHLLRSLELETEARVHAGYRDMMGGAQRADFDPLEMDEYSELQRLSRALAESMNDLINIEGDLSDQLRKADYGLMENIQVGRKIYQDLLSTRLVALNVLSPRLKRVVRQTAQELGKQAELVLQGDECELDRHLLQRLTAPLEHLLRNALAHGIELPHERHARGKSPQGLITLEVIQADAELVIKVTDDGAGLNREALRKRAIERGFIKPQDDISQAKLDRLILQPGFTTATTVSQIAGRGVGLDVVFSEIKSLGGSLQIESETGKGVIFSLRVPFTMASNPVLFVSVQSQIYGLGMGSIQGLIRLSGEHVKQKLNDSSEFLVFDGVQYALGYLGQALRLRGLRDIQDDMMFPVVFTLLNGQAKAWVVDSIVGRRDVVMQSLGVLFKNCPLYSAATITPDGQVVLLPDLHELVRTPFLEAQAPVITSGVLMKRANDQSRIMVVDDSITVRKVTEKFLAAESFAVETAKDGMEALEKLRDFGPDLLLLDIEMPRMDGFELLRHMRQTPEWQHLPVIMISSRTAEKHREHATSLGANDFLGKPYQNQLLLDKIREQLEGSHLALEVVS